MCAHCARTVFLKKGYLLISFMFKCEICYDWCSRIKITKQWWDIAKNDWNSLNGKDLPYYIAILAVLRETTKEIFHANKNHSNMKTDKRVYALVSNENCEFTPLTEQQKTKWRGLCQTIQAFRNGAAHISFIKNMKPIFSTQIRNPEDALQDYYRYALFPHLFQTHDLKKIHELVRQTILCDVRSLMSNIPPDRIKYELYHVERGPFIDLLHTKMIELLKEVKVW